MELNARQLRIGIRSPAALARLLRSEAVFPVEADTPRNPQRQWIDASISRYMRQGRRVEVLLDHYDDRTSRSARLHTAATEIANGRAMLKKFAELDLTEPTPDRVQLPKSGVDVLGVWITLGADLAYETPNGWLLRLLITDQEVVRPEHLHLTRRCCGPALRAPARRRPSGCRPRLAAQTPQANPRLVEVVSGVRYAPTRPASGRDHGGSVRSSGLGRRPGASDAPPHPG
jgi:hypothetical protein